MKQYFVISNMDGETTVTPFSKDGLIEALEGNELGDPEFIEELIEEDTNYWGDKYLIIKGEIITPEPKEKVITYDVD